MGLNEVNAAQPQQQPQRPKGKGPAELAKALGVSEEQLQKMSKQEVEKLAKEKHVKLEEYGAPPPPPPRQQGGAKPNSIF